MKVLSFENTKLKLSTCYRHFDYESSRQEWHTLCIKGSVACSLKTLGKNPNTMDKTLNLELDLKGLLGT